MKMEIFESLATKGRNPWTRSGGSFIAMKEARYVSPYVAIRLVFGDLPPTFLPYSDRVIRLLRRGGAGGAGSFLKSSGRRDMLVAM